MRVVFFSLLANFCICLSSQAAVITPTTPATFSFDTSSLGNSFSINGGGWNCYVTCSNFIDATELFDVLASARFDFGTLAGSADIGSLTVTNPFDFPIADFNGAIFGSNKVDILASIDTLFLTIVYVNDVFAVDWVTLTALLPDTTGAFLTGTFVAPVDPVGEVPVPGSLLLFLSGVLGLTFGLKRDKAKGM